MAHQCILSVVQLHATKTLQRDKTQGGRSQLCAHNGDILKLDRECDQHVHVCGVYVWLRTTLLAAPLPLWQPGLGEALM